MPCASPQMSTRDITICFTHVNTLLSRLELLCLEEMRFLRTLAPWLLIACLAQQVSVSTGARERGRKGKGEGRGAEEQSPGAPSNREHKAGKAATPGGQFTTKDKFRCKWAAREDNDTVKLGVNCQNLDARYTGGVTDFECEYAGKPATCPGYGSNPAGFWKQVARALKKLQKKLCMDDRALVRTGMCKRAPRDAHFKLDPHSSVASAQSPEDKMRQPETPGPWTPSASTTTTTTTTTTQTPGKPATGRSCTESVDQKILADEYCSSSWASLCTFFFAMVQSGDC